MEKQNGKKWWAPYLWLLPSIILISVFVVFPILIVFRLSFSDISKAGVVGYMKNTAVRLAKYGAVVNAISPGGVLTDSNRPVTEDPELWARIMEATPLKKWLTEDELAEWVWFLTADNRSASGIDVLVDNGELALNSTFVWPD